jgi:hypothetical protein
MKMSETILALAPALVKAQSQIEHAVKDSKNPHFKSSYADLASVLAVLRKPLADNDLCVLQSPRRSDGGIDVETMVLHKSGEWISDLCFIPITKWDAQGVGSGTTYGRRYGLMSIFCIGTEDDDGNGAVGNGVSNTDNGSARMKAAMKIAEKGAEALRVWWSDMSPGDRKMFSSDELKQLKATATAIDNKDDADV